MREGRVVKKTLIAAALILCLIPAALAADIPYRTYVYDAYNTERATPAFYKPNGSAEFALKNAADICCALGKVYLLDSGNDSIIVLDSDMRPLYTLDSLGTKGATGIYVAESGRIAVADVGNSRALVLEADGTIAMEYTKPVSHLYDPEIAFNADKVLLDSAGNLYVSVKGLYKGAVVFDARGEFKGYYGGNQVETTAQVLTDWWWKSIMSSEQRNRMNRSLPVAFTNFDIDSRDFVYTCSSNITTTSAKARKLNTSGISLWERTRGEVKFGDPDVITDTSLASDMSGKIVLNKVSTLFRDICALDNGFIALLDSTSHIFLYDDYANMICGFSASGAQEGTFISPVAIDAIGNDLYVLDQRTGCLSRLSLTAFGEDVFSALALYNDGRYAEAGEAWRDVLDGDGQYELARVGMGMALLKTGDARGAMEQFWLGNQREQYSSAFSVVRVAFIREYGVALALAFIGLIILLRLVKRFAGDSIAKFCVPVTRHARMALHPFAGMSELSISLNYSYGFAGVMIVLLLLLDALKFEYTGFAFLMHPAYEPYNLLRGAVSAIGLVFVWSITNWSVTTLTDGKGTFKAVIVGTLYAMMPIFAAGAINLVLSNALTLEEKAFMNWISSAGYIWAAIMLVSSQMNIHEFSLGKALRCALLTIIGMIVILLLIFMMVVLVQKVFGIGETIFRELTIRS